VFVGGCTLEAVEAICTLDESLALYQQLGDRLSLWAK